MIYLDTGCLLKLYYPEPESPAVVAAIVGEVVAFSSLHELEIVAAMEAKVFRKEAQPGQVSAALAAIHQDLAKGKLSAVPVNWSGVFRGATELAQTHVAAIGCRSLDILHCALARFLGATPFVSSDRRQIALARAEGMSVQAIGLE